MKLSINGQQTEWDMAGYENLSGAVTDMREKLMVDRRVIVDTLVDGKEYDSCPEIWEQSVADFGELELTVEGAFTLCRNVVEGLRESLSNLPAAKPAFQDLLVSEKRNQAMFVVHEVMELCHSILESCINVAALTATEPEEISVNDQTFDEASARMSALLQELGTALQANNYVECADLLEHEIVPYLENWRGTLDCLGLKVEQAEAKA